MLSKKDRVEIKMIMDDTYFYSDIVQQLSEEEIAEVIIFGLLPYLSLYVIEAFQSLSDHDPSAAETLKRKHEEIIRASRNRVKLLDGTDINEFIEYFRTIMNIHHNWFMKGHKGILGWLKRALQMDLGVYTYDHKVIGTTHVAHLNLGQDVNDEAYSRYPFGADVKSLARSVGIDIGEFIGTLLRVFHNSKRPHTFIRFDVDPGLLKLSDVKFRQHYVGMFKGIKEPPIGATLSLFLCAANFMTEIMKRLVQDSPTTYFKLKFITLFHLGSSINNLQNFCYSNRLHTKRSKEFFAEILSDRDLKRIRSERRLRNVLVHYQIREVPEAALHEARPLYGLIEYFFDGMTFENVNELVDKQLIRLAKLLNEWSA